MEDAMSNVTQVAEVTTNVQFEGVAGENFVRLVNEYNTAKALAKEMKDLQATFEAEIRAAMGEATTAYVGTTVRATIAIRNRSNLNKERLQAGWPEAIEACTTHTVYTVLDAK